MSDAGKECWLTCRNVCGSTATAAAADAAAATAAEVRDRDAKLLINYVMIS